MLKTDPRALGKPGKPSTNQATHPIPSIQLVVPWRMAKVRGRCEGTDSKWERDLRLVDSRPVPKALCFEPGLITSCLFDIQDHPG